MSPLERAVRKTIGAVVDDPAVKTAVSYVSPELVVRVTRFGRPQRKNARNTDLRIQIGQPNYAARQFVKQALKAGEPFPVKKVQIKFYPKRKKG